MIVFAALCLALAVLPALIYLGNLWFLRPPPRVQNAPQTRPQISVLIPARNEERSIVACVESVLANTGVELEVIVLDDHSEDATAALVREMAQKDGRVRLETAPPLPSGWCGKQHACYTLAQRARFDLLTFLDADVRLTPEALARMIAFQQCSQAELVSGFPRQETGSWLEKLVIPLINWLLTNYLPMCGMRWTTNPRFGAGCGQWFLTTRSAYATVGGHAAVRASLHDGVTLPRAYRNNGLQTHIADATDIAVCRMYHSAGQVWFGLAKNAREGLAAWPAILVWTLLLGLGHVAPFLLLPLGLDLAYDGAIAQFLFPGDREPIRQIGRIVTLFAGLACGLSLLVRLDTARRFRASWFGAFLHPFGITALLAIQWYAIVQAVRGKSIGWKGRAHPSSAGA